MKLAAGSRRRTTFTAINKRMLIENGPLGIASSTARIPRSSDSLPTVTDSPGSGLPRVAARIAISVATQLAAAARMYQPGGAASALPPTEAGISVCIEAPSAPDTVQSSPSFITAVAFESG